MGNNLAARDWVFGRTFQTHGTMYVKARGKERFWHKANTGLSGYGGREKDAPGRWTGRKRQALLNLDATLQLWSDTGSHRNPAKGWKCAVVSALIE